MQFQALLCALSAHKKVRMMQERLPLTHNLLQNLVSALHVKNMDEIPGQKCVRTGQINLGLSDALHIPNADGQKICKPFLNLNGHSSLANSK